MKRILLVTVEILSVIAIIVLMILRFCDVLTVQQWGNYFLYSICSLILSVTLEVDDDDDECF